MDARSTSDDPRCIGCVLIVDDDTLMVELINHLLAVTFGDRIRRFFATDTLSAQRIVQEQQIDLVVTDLEMGGPSGFHLLHWLREWDPLIQTIAITGHDTQDALRSALALGASDFILKPIRHEYLLSSVSFFLNRVRRWQPLLQKPAEAGDNFGVNPLMTSQ